MSYYEEINTETYKSEVLGAEDNSRFSALINLIPVEAENPAYTYQGAEHSEYEVISSGAHGMGQKWASFEAGRIALTGDFYFPDDTALFLLPDEYAAYYGKWWTTESTVIITATIATAVPFSGVNLVFDDKAGEWAQAFTITAYNDSTKIGEWAYTENDSAIVNILPSAATGNVNKIIVAIDATSWSAENFIKVSALRFGSVFSFTDDDIFSYEQAEEGSTFDTSLSIPQASLTVDNSDGVFSVYGEKSISAYLKARMQAECNISIAGQNVLMSRWRIYAWSTDEDRMTATFTLRPSVGFEQRFTTVTMANVSLEDAYNDMANDLGLRDNVYLAPSFWETEGFTANSYFGEGVSATSAFQIVANSGGCFWDIGRDDMYQLLNWKLNGFAVARTISDDDLLSYPEIAYIFPYKNLVVQWQDVDTSSGESSMVSHEYNVNVSGDDIGETLYIYAQQIDKQSLAAKIASEYVAPWLQYGVSYSADIKGDPALRPFDAVTVQLDGEEKTVVLTKVTHIYGADILRTRIEGVIER